MWQYRESNGFVFPANDHLIEKYLLRSLPEMDRAINLCRKRDVVVQAGGNCGLWPHKLAGLFDAVYTFEPDPVNFVALAINTADMRNVIRFQAALGAEPGFVEMNRTGKNTGAHYVEGDGLLPTMRIDDLGIKACDLIYLDVEGSELAALRGAKRTIDRHKPVIAFEEKGLSPRFGVEAGETENWVRAFCNYDVAERVNNDVIMVPR